ncbi:MAG: hypothetical protein QM756_10215 [Polyangiaceae bacterium]
MTEHSPLPPEPVAGPAGKTLGLFFVALIFLLGIGSLALIWGYGDIETLLRILASFLVVAMLAAVGALLLRQR